MSDPTMIDNRLFLVLLLLEDRAVPASHPSFVGVVPTGLLIIFIIPILGILIVDLHNFQIIVFDYSIEDRATCPELVEGGPFPTGLLKLFH